MNREQCRVVVKSNKHIQIFVFQVDSELWLMITTNNHLGIFTNYLIMLCTFCSVFVFLSSSIFLHTLTCLTCLRHCKNVIVKPVKHIQIHVSSLSYFDYFPHLSGIMFKLSSIPRMPINSFSMMKSQTYSSLACSNDLCHIQQCHSIPNESTSARKEEMALWWWYCCCRFTISCLIFLTVSQGLLGVDYPWDVIEWI